jgi:hypothetical protein
MALEAILDSLDGVDKSLSSHYVEKDGKFHLDIKGFEPKKPDGNAPDKGDWIPKARFNEVNEKRKSAEQVLTGIASELMEDIPEDFRDIVPDLPPEKKISWIRNAIKKGLFGTKQEGSGPDSKRPGGKSPIDFKDMKPQTIMAMGYKK